MEPQVRQDRKVQKVTPELVEQQVPRALPEQPGLRVPKLETVEARELTQEARDAGVISDRLVRLVGSDHRRPPNLVLREVVIVPADDPGHPVYLLTTLLDLDASVFVVEPGPGDAGVLERGHDR